jgi:hypothetical protein
VIAGESAGFDVGRDLQSRVLRRGLHVRRLFFLALWANPEIAAGVPGADDDEGGDSCGSDRSAMTSGRDQEMTYV